MNEDNIDLTVGWQDAGLRQCMVCGAFFKADDGECDFCVEAEEKLENASESPRVFNFESTLI